MFLVLSETIFFREPNVLVANGNFCQLYTIVSSCFSVVVGVMVTLFATAKVALGPAFGLVLKNLDNAIGMCTNTMMY